MDRPTAIGAPPEVGSPQGPAAEREGDARFNVARLERLLARRQRLSELGLCVRGSPCAWHRAVFDRAIVSYLLAAEEMGLVSRRGALLSVRLEPASRPAA